jgi:hypothetical protein
VQAQGTRENWAGKLKRLRLDLTGGTPATGTRRVDYIRIEDSAPAK